MRKYYLFIIKKEYYNIYKDKSYVLYKIIENLYKLRAYDFSYGIKIYKKICLPFAVKVLNNYLNKRIKHKKLNDKVIKIYSEFENTYIQINYSCIVVKSDVNMPQIMKILNIYNKNIFVVDFNNIDYFWLNDYFKATIIN
ncbi:MAG: sporulation inhibitor of replication protein SirA [Bacilli bacterium]|nr:sporulation inhibitor of replication protein SirA [Bacilli bacterium]